MMSPLADPVIDFWGPGIIVNYLATETKLKLKSRWRFCIEREHAVIRMLTESLHDTHAISDATVVGEADFIHVSYFKHEMVHLFLLSTAYGDGVVTTVGMEEFNVYGISEHFAPYMVAQPKPENLGIELVGCDLVNRVHDQVPQAKFVCNEASFNHI